MLDQIIQFSIKNKLIVGLFTLALIGYGAYETTRLPIDAVPDITNNQVQVITTAPSLGAPDVERLITFPIEQANSNIPGLKEIRSFSRFGLSLVTIVFNDDVDIYWARQQISERLQQAQSQIPQGIATPSMAPVTTGLGEIYQYVVRAKPGYESKYSLRDLRTIQDWMVRRQLLGTQGVADVSTFGGELKQYEVSVMPDKLNSFGLTITDVFNALESNNENTGGAYIEKGPTVLYIRSEGLVGNKDDIENIVVKTTGNGMPVLIRDLAKVGEGAATRYGAVCYNDEGEVAGAVVMMLKGENSSTVIKKVKEKIEAIQKTLPEGIVIEPFLDRTKMVNNAISTVETNLLEGALIVVFVLVFFLGNFRAGLIVASVIPLSMLFAIILMNMFGVGGNLMSLGAIDFGLIVDGAVIVVEAIMHQLTHSKHFKETNRLSTAQMNEEVHHSSSRIMNAAVFGQIIILIVYLPIFALQGIEGKMFKPMAQTVSFAILGAFILSLTYIPMMSALFISKNITHKKSMSDRLMEHLERWYQHTLEKVLNFPKTILAVSLALLAGAVLLMGTLGGEFIPELEEGDFAVDTRVLTGSNLNTTIEATQKTAGVLLKNFPEVQKVVTKIGSGEIPTDPMPIEASDMMVILKDKKEWTSAKSFDELAQKMSAKIQAIPGVTAGFQFPVQMRFNELMTGARQDVVCKIFGEDLDTLAKYAQVLGEISSSVEGAIELYVEQVNGMPQIVVNYKRDAIAKYGLNISEINRTLNAAFAGAATGQVYEGEKRFDLVVRVASEARKTISDVQNLLIATPSGMQIPLHQVADVQEIEGPNQIQREDAKRRIIIGFNVRGRDVQSIVKELQQKVETQVKFPAGYYVTYGGAFENLQAAKERLSIAVPVALALIFLMLYFAFGSVKQSLLIYSAIPLSAIGGIVALWMRDLPFSISAGVGFIALFGVAVLNGIVLISEFNRLKKEGWDDTRRVVLMGTKIRLRSIMMTALAPSLGFIPMAISMGAGAEVQRPLATVVIGGIVSATLLTLFVLPVLFVLFEKSGRRKAKHVATIAILMVFSATIGFAQTSPQPIALSEALDMAFAKNPGLESAGLNEQFYEKMKGTWRELDKTNFSVELGQFNSRAFDNKIGISQGIQFPKVYKTQKQLLSEQALAAQAQSKMTQRDLKAELSRLFYGYIWLQEKEKLLQEADSVYRVFEEKALLRFQKGETNLLEKTTAQMHRQQISNQLAMLRQDLQIVLQRFNFLLRAESPRIPTAAAPELPLPVLADTFGMDNLPQMQFQQHLLNTSRFSVAAEKAKLLPDLSIGLNSHTIIGYQRVGDEDRYFSSGKRFTFVGAGVAVPIFSRAQRARISAYEVQVLQQQKELDWLGQRLRAERITARQEVQKYWESLQFYQNQALPSAKTIVSTANRQFAAGEINYLEWVMLVNQSFELQGQFLDEQDRYNQAVLHLQTFINE
ncbi:MAG: CusA/CzcA family heavy metal efflux RND transporter [Saprospiraceae bacterium]|nr:CusA/CzcA family heavy metal efflux RND transporter [Saprospiraceae bacterium]